MNLKLVAVSMSVLGLISSPVFADTDTAAMPKKHHHKHHHHHHKHAAHHDYKAMGAMPAAAAPAEMAPMAAANTVSASILDEINQNTAMNKPMPEWFNRIGVSGGINFDTGKWGSRTVSNQPLNGFSPQNGNYNIGNSASGTTLTSTGPKAGYTGENTKRFSINNAYLNVTADVNEWTKALAVLSYTDASMFYDQAYTTTPDNVDHVIGTTNTNLGNRNSSLTLEQAVIHFGNFDCSPFFLDVGKQFADFGRYKVHPITASMDQALTESLHNSVKLGAVTDMGLHGSVSMFQDGTYRYNDTNNKENTLNYGAAVGYAHPDDQFGYDLGVGYMYNMLGVNDVAGMVTSYTAGYTIPAGQPGAGTAIPGYNGYHNHVGEVAAYADVNYDAFSLMLRYATATQHFSQLDLARSQNHLNTGAKPWAAGVTAGYDFNAWTKNQNVYLGYQASHDSVFLNLPHSRYVLGYSMDVLKNTKLSAEWDHDNAWNNSNGGPSGGNSNLVSLRAAVKFG